MNAKARDICHFLGEPQQWSSPDFFLNLYLQTGVIMISHSLSGNLDSQFAANVWRTLGGLLLAIAVGLVSSSRVNEKIFRTRVIIVLIASGIQLLR